METGVIMKLTPENRARGAYTYKDVMDLLGVSRDKAYTMIRKMRQELIDKDMLPDYYPAGKIPGWYFKKRCMIEEVRDVEAAQ